MKKKIIHMIFGIVFKSLVEEFTGVLTVKQNSKMENWFLVDSSPYYAC